MAEDQNLPEKTSSNKHSILDLKYPLKYGIITAWDDMEKIWPSAAPITPSFQEVTSQSSRKLSNSDLFPPTAEVSKPKSNRSENKKMVERTNLKNSRYKHYS